MEVDYPPSSSSPSESRHSSPFRITLPATPSATNVVGPLRDRKRRRSNHSLSGPLSPSHEFHTSEAQDHQDERDKDDAVSKRRHISISSSSTDSSHRFRPLGAAYNSASTSFDTGYAVDSTMHSLSLASPSPPPVEADEGSPQTDVDMGDGETSASSSTSTNSKTSQTFIPRQVRHSHLVRAGHTSSLPFRSSPLVHCERLQSSSTMSKSSGSRFPSSSSDMSDGSAPNRELVAAGNAENFSALHTSTAASSRVVEKVSHTTARSSRSMDGVGGYIRTPSPTPSSLSPSGSPKSNESGDGRRLHHSPGSSQTSFPGGKQMLRYTMGYREDCPACKSKTAGHYGHVMHR